MKEKIKEIIILIVLIGIVSPIITTAFVRTYEISYYPGFWDGIWHGLLAPYALIAKFFLDENDIIVYASYNSGRSYNLGFLIGLIGSPEIGWFCATLSYIGHLF